MTSKNDKLSEINVTLKENTSDYYSDVYSPGETKEQLVIGEEVVNKSEYTASFDTADVTINITDRVYTLDVPNPDGQLFSMNIDGNSKTFKIGPYGISTTAYTDLETQLKSWLGSAYIINYVSGTSYSIERLDKGIITHYSPNLFRTITLNNWDAITKITIDIDGTSVTVDGATYPNKNDALDYVMSQMPVSTYLYYSASGGLITIGRIDSAIPVISSTEYNRYTYQLHGYNTTNPTSGNLLGSGGTEWVKTYKLNYTIDGTIFSYTYPSGITWSTVPISYTPTNLTGYPTTNDDNTNTSSSILIDVIYSGLSYSYVKGGITKIGNSLVSYEYTFDFHKTDYSKVTYSKNNQYVLDSGLSIVTYDSLFVNTETNHRATIAVSTYSEIIITLSMSSSNFFIPVKVRYNKIKVTATSQNGSSEGLYDKRVQNCTATYGTNTEFVNDFIFKTDTNNYGKIEKIKRGGFTISWTTNTSNKINFVCSL